VVLPFAVGFERQPAHRDRLVAAWVGHPGAVRLTVPVQVLLPSHTVEVTVPLGCPAGHGPGDAGHVVDRRADGAEVTTLGVVSPTDDPLRISVAVLEGGPVEKGRGGGPLLVLAALLPDR
jgi:hypothetical protein